MSDQVKKISYAYVMVPNRAGQGIKVLNALCQMGVDLTAFSAFPGRGGKTINRDRTRTATKSVPFSITIRE